jgi:O-succinylbenzoic acid--CoA ligase
VSTLSLLDAAREQPHAPAVVLEAATLDHAELAARVQRRLPPLSRLRSVAPGAFVSVTIENTLTGLELVHALLESGIAFLPLHPRLTESEREALLQRLSPSAHVAADAERIELTALDLARRPHAAGNSADPLEAPLALIMTSGTTALPRAAVLSRRAFLASAMASAQNLGWHPEDRWLLSLPLAHIGGLSVVTRCLLARKPLVLADSWQRAASGEALIAAMTEGRATLASVVPTQLLRMQELLPRAPLPAHVRAILTGGAATSSALLDESAARGWPVLTTYGSTEACSQIATQAPGSAPNRAGCGKPLEGMRVKLEGGAICLQGPSLFSGYHPAQRSPFDAEGWLRTQDLGRIDEHGELHVLGRADEVIISGGENVAPWEVERALERCNGVRQACVFGVPHPRWGQVVAAALLLEPGERGEQLARLVEHARRELAAFRRPRRVACLDAFALNRTGKIDRARTRELALEALLDLA